MEETLETDDVSSVAELVTSPPDEVGTSSEEEACELGELDSVLDSTLLIDDSMEDELGVASSVDDTILDELRVGSDADVRVTSEAELEAASEEIEDSEEIRISELELKLGIISDELETISDVELDKISEDELSGISELELELGTSLELELGIELELEIELDGQVSLFTTSRNLATGDALFAPLN